MSNHGWDIDEIVREVLRRLQTAPSPENVVSPPKPSSLPKTTNVNAKELRLEDRVVTLAAVKDRLQGIRRVRLCPNAVVTPSARDEFRKRGISVDRRASESAEITVNTPLVIARADTNYDPSALLQQIGGESIETGGLLAAIGSLGDRVRGDRQLGVLLTARPAPALCLANRQPGVRAALGGSVRVVRDAVETVGANLLILDPTGRSLADLTNTLREFLRGGNRNCPKEFCEVL